MKDQWNPKDKMILNPENIEKMKSKIAQNVILPGDTKIWLAALRAKDIVKVRKLLKAERKTLPTKYKRLYRDPDETLLNLIHFMRTHYPFFTSEEKKESAIHLENEQMRRDGITHPLMNKKLF